MATTIKAIATGKTYTPEIEGVALPVYLIPDDLHPNTVVEVDGVGPCYAWADDALGDGWRLCRELQSVDKGDNVHRTRRAPEDTAGISAPAVLRGPTLNVMPVFESVVGYACELSVTPAQIEALAEAASTAEGDAKLALCKALETYRGRHVFLSSDDWEAGDKVVEILGLQGISRLPKGAK